MLNKNKTTLADIGTKEVVFDDYGEIKIGILKSMIPKEKDESMQAYVVMALHKEEKKVYEDELFDSIEDFLEYKKQQYRDYHEKYKTVCADDN